MRCKDIIVLVTAMLMVCMTLPGCEDSCPDGEMTMYTCEQSESITVQEDGAAVSSTTADMLVSLGSMAGGTSYPNHWAENVSSLEGSSYFYGPLQDAGIWLAAELPAGHWGCAEAYPDCRQSMAVVLRLSSLDIGDTIDITDDSIVDVELLSGLQALADGDTGGTTYVGDAIAYTMVSGSVSLTRSGDNLNLTLEMELEPADTTGLEGDDIPPTLQIRSTTSYTCTAETVETCG